ncbi:MAG: transcription elongation factor Spt5 [Thermoplasmatales archaeon]
MIEIEYKPGSIVPEHRVVIVGEQREIESGNNKRVPFKFTVINETSEDIKGSVNFGLDIKETKNEIEWFIGVVQKRPKASSILPGSEDYLTLDYKVPKGSKEVYEMYVETPKGGEIGDSATLFVKDDSGKYPTFTIKLKQSIIIIKTTIGQEIRIARDIGMKAQSENADYIYSVLVPPDLKGYVFVETLYPDRTMALLRNVRGARNMISGDVDIKEIEIYLTSKPATESLEVGSLVQIIDGPFKNEVARITHIDQARDEITLELQNAVIPIPLTVKADSVRVLDKEVK